MELFFTSGTLYTIKNADECFFQGLTTSPTRTVRTESISTWKQGVEDFITLCRFIYFSQSLFRSLLENDALVKRKSFLKKYTFRYFMFLFIYIYYSTPTPNILSSLKNGVSSLFQITKMKIYLLLIAVSCVVIRSTARPDGAPRSACSSLMPSHSGIGVQRNRPPFTITAVKHGNKIRGKCRKLKFLQIKYFMLKSFNLAIFLINDVSKPYRLNGVKLNFLVNTPIKCWTRLVSSVHLYRLILFTILYDFLITNFTRI